MGQLDSAVQLPKTDSAPSDQTDEYTARAKAIAAIAEKHNLDIEITPITTPVNYSMAPASTLVQETSSKVAATFGGDNAQFSQIVSNATATPAAAATITNVSTQNINGTIPKIDITSVSHKVTLRDPSYKNASLNNTVLFDVMPQISEQRAADYENLAIPQMPGEFLKYKGTKATTWNLQATFVCRTRDEATERFRAINLLRSWTQGFFGYKQDALYKYEKKNDLITDNGLSSGGLGAPPPVLLFQGYRSLIGEVPVVLTQLSWNWPKDCDWIPTNQKDNKGELIPFPTVMELTINLTESFSADQFNHFSLKDFRVGDMVGAFSTNSADDPDTGEAEGEGTGITSTPAAEENTQQVTTASGPTKSQQSATLTTAYTSAKDDYDTSAKKVQMIQSVLVSPPTPAIQRDLQNQLNTAQAELDANASALTKADIDLRNFQRGG